MKVDVKGDVLTITIDVSKAALEAATASKSGKTKIVDSTRGFTGIASPAGQLALSLNLTTK
jgi:hypothetical protein